MQEEQNHQELMWEILKIRMEVFSLLLAKGLKVILLKLGLIQRRRLTSIKKKLGKVCLG
jgi:hypothetical protein